MQTTSVPDGPRRPTLSRRHSVGIASARSWLLTVLGEFVLPADDPVWTSTMVTVLGGLGLEEKAARQALARTAGDGLLETERVGRRARWRLTDAGRHLLTDGAERIYSFAGQASTWDGHWLVISTAVPEGQRDLRHRLRTRMAWAGFGSLGTNVWISPDTAREAEAKQLLDDLGLSPTTTTTRPFVPSSAPPLRTPRPVAACSSSSSSRPSGASTCTATARASGSSSKPE